MHPLGVVVGVALGAFAGFLGGMLGIGGGVIMIPGMVLLLGLDQHTAQGVSLGTIALMGLAGAFVQSRQDNVNFRAALWIAPAAIVFSLLGAYLAGILNPRLLTFLFSLLLLFNGVRLLLHK